MTGVRDEGGIENGSGLLLTPHCAISSCRAAYLPACVGIKDLLWAGGVSRADSFVLQPATYVALIL
jgi:hypothetical protein